MKKKYVFIFSIILCFIVSITPVYAKALYGAVVSQEQSIFSVIVPTSFPVAVHESGTILVATNAKIVNNSRGSVRIKNLLYEPLASYTLKELGQKISNRDFTVTVDLNDSIINGLQTYNLNYSINLVKPDEGLAPIDIVDTVFILEWNE